MLKLLYLYLQQIILVTALKTCNKLIRYFECCYAVKLSGYKTRQFYIFE